jgi:hypothetical protein
MSNIVITAANWFWVGELTLGSAGGTFRGEEMTAYHEEYNFGNVPAVHPEKIDLIGR